MNVKPSKELIEQYEKALASIVATPYIKYDTRKTELDDMKWFIFQWCNGRKVYLFFNLSKAKIVIDLNESSISNLSLFRTPDYREIITHEQTKQTHTKDSRQRLQGAGFFRLLGHYASHIRQLLCK